MSFLEYEPRSRIYEEGNLEESVKTFNTTHLNFAYDSFDVRVVLNYTPC